MQRATITLLVLALVGVANATHPTPPYTLEADRSWTQASIATSIGTLQGVATDGTNYYASATSALAKYSAEGQRAWLTDTASDGSPHGSQQTDVTYHDGRLYVGHQAGGGAIGIYSAATGAFIQSVSLGSGTPSAITFGHGSFWVVWTTNGNQYEIRQYDTSFQLLATFPLPRTYATDTGPQGAAWLDAALLLPRHASGGANHGMDVFHYHRTQAPSFTYVHTLAYITWTASGRTEVSSQGIDIMRDHDRYSIVAAGRDAASGNGGGTGGVLHTGIKAIRNQAYDATLLTVQEPSSTLLVSRGTLQGVAYAPDAVLATTTNELLRFDEAGTLQASRETGLDGAAGQNGDLTIHDDRIYVHTSDYPAKPRQAYITVYDATTLDFIDEKPLGNQDGAGGGVSAWNGHLWAPNNRDLGGDLTIRQIDPATLTIIQEHELGHYGSFSPQGIGIVAGYAFIPHANVDALDALDGWLIFEWTGTTWSFHGSLAYPSWMGGDGKRLYASQGVHFQVTDCTVTAWSVGRYYDGHGHGQGEVARHPVALGSLDACPNPDPDDPGNPDNDPPGSGGLQDDQKRWPLFGLAAASLLVLLVAAWSFRHHQPAKDAPSDRRLILAASLILATVAGAMYAWTHL